MRREIIPTRLDSTGPSDCGRAELQRATSRKLLKVCLAADKEEEVSSLNRLLALQLFPTFPFCSPRFELRVLVPF